MLGVKEVREGRRDGTVANGGGGLSCWLQHWKTEQKEEEKMNNEWRDGRDGGMERRMEGRVTVRTLISFHTCF